MRTRLPRWDTNTFSYLPVSFPRENPEYILAFQGSNTEKMRVITFKAEEDLLLKLDLYAMNKRTPRSEIIRDALRKYLEAAGGI